MKLDIVTDLDDTLFRLTATYRADPSRYDQLEPVPGVQEFLSRYGTFTTLLTQSENFLKQMEKIEHFGWTKFFVRKHFVREKRQKESVINGIVHSLRDPKDLILIGDRVDCELEIGARLGATTIRVKLPGGKYSDLDARCAPTFTVTNFNEVIEILQAFGPLR